MLLRLCWSASANAAAAADDDDGDGDGEGDHLYEAVSHVGAVPVRDGQRSFQRQASWYAALSPATVA